MTAVCENCAERERCTSVCSERTWQAKVCSQHYTVKKERRNNVGRTGKICGEARKAYKLSLVRNSRYLQL